MAGRFVGVMPARSASLVQLSFEASFSERLVGIASCPFLVVEKLPAEDWLGSVPVLGLGHVLVLGMVVANAVAATSFFGTVANGSA